MREEHGCPDPVSVCSDADGQVAILRSGDSDLMSRLPSSLLFPGLLPSSDTTARVRLRVRHAESQMPSVHRCEHAPQLSIHLIDGTERARREC